MKAIYWIQRLDNIYDAFIALLMVAVIAIIMLGIAYSVEEECKKPNDVTLKRWLVFSIVSATIFANGLIFMPTTEEALTIIGVGGAIEQLQEKDTLKELPDKCVRALDTWLDSLQEDKK